MSRSGEELDLSTSLDHVCVESPTEDKDPIASDFMTPQLTISEEPDSPPGKCEGGALPKTNSIGPQLSGLRLLMPKLAVDSTSTPVSSPANPSMMKSPLEAAFSSSLSKSLFKLRDDDDDDDDNDEDHNSSSSSENQSGENSPVGLGIPLGCGTSEPDDEAHLSEEISEGSARTPYSGAFNDAVGHHASDTSQGLERLSSEEEQNMHSEGHETRAAEPPCINFDATNHHAAPPGD